MADLRITEGPPMLRSENARLAGFVYVDIRGRDLRCAVLDVRFYLRPFGLAGKQPYL